MDDNDKIYNKLKEKYTDKEIAESFVFSGRSLTDEERKELSAAIKERRENRTEEEKEEIRQFIKKLKEKNEHNGDN